MFCTQKGLMEVNLGPWCWLPLGTALAVSGVWLAPGWTAGHPMYMGTAAISSADYVHACIDHADLILMVGHDVVEKPPFFMRPAASGREGTRVVHINYFTAQVGAPPALLHGLCVLQGRTCGPSSLLHAGWLVCFARVQPAAPLAGLG